MIKQVLIKNYRTVNIESLFEAEHILGIEVMPKEAHEVETFGASPIRLALPKLSIEDNTRIEDKYYIMALIDDEHSFTDREYTFTNGFLIPKDSGEFDHEHVEAVDIKQYIDNSELGDRYKIIRSEDGESFIAISDNGIIIRSGDTVFTVSPDSISKMGEEKRYSLPNENHAIMKESGFLRMLPKCFLPPFAIPDYLPDFGIMLTISTMRDIINRMR